MRSAAITSLSSTGLRSNVRARADEGVVGAAPPRRVSLIATSLGSPSMSAKLPDGHASVGDPWDDLPVVGRLDVEAAFEAAGYRIEAVIGRGGVGTVYRAVQLTLQRDVALKLLTAEQSTDSSFRQMFLDESILAASLDHPHVVPVYDAGEVEQILYMAMRYVPGATCRG